LKNIVLLAVLCLGVWGYYQKDYLSKHAVSDETTALDDNTIQNDHETNDKTKTRFKCDGRQYCSQMTSREEAEYFIRNCPNTKMDGDHDGIPCENDSRF